MVIYTPVDDELDKMKSDICGSIMQSTEEVVEQYYPIDPEIYRQYSDEQITDFLGEMNILKKSDFSPIQENDDEDDEAEENSIDVVGLIQQTMKRYGYLPLSLVKEIRQYYHSLADTMREIDKYCKEPEDVTLLKAKDKSINDECGKLLKIIEKAEQELEEVYRLCEKRKMFSADKIIKSYKEIVKLQGIIEEKLGFDRKSKYYDEVSEKEEYGSEKDMPELKDKWQFQIREFLRSSFFVHRCKCYANTIKYKTIVEDEFMTLVNERAVVKRNDYKDYLKKCINVFAAVKHQESSHTLKYPRESEEILFDFVQDAKWRKALTEFAKIHNETKRMAKSLESMFYRTEISELENKVFGRNENYSYELCCTWNELGGFGISATIAGAMFGQRKIITKEYLTKKDEKMEKFYYELERCCKVLIDFAKTESWLMGIELTHIVFGLYCSQWKDKKPLLEDLCKSMACMAEILESMPLKKILEQYSYKEQMIGWDGFPRRDFATMWEDDEERYKKYFYRKDLEKYEGRSNVNLFYVRVFQIVFRCVNSDSWK